MKLNTDVWTDGKAYSTLGNDFYLPNVGTFGAFAELVNAGKLQLNTEFDQSILLGTVFNPVFSQAQYIKISLSSSGFTFDIKKFVPKNTGRFLYTRITGSGNQYLTAEQFYNSRIGYGQSNVNDLWQSPVIKMPITSLIFKIRLVCLNRVKLSQGSHESVAYIDYDTAINTENFDQLYIICGAQCVPYYGNKTYRSSNSAYIITIGDYLTYPNWTDGGINENVFCPITQSYSLIDGIGGIVDYDYYNFSTAIFRHCPVELFEIQGTYPFVYSRFKGGIADAEKILNIFAELGYYYCTKESTATSAVLGVNATDPDVRIGYLDENGKLTGEPLNGEDTTKTPQSKWDNPTDFTSKNPFNGIENTDPNNYTDKIDLNKPTLTPVDVFNRSYAINATTIRNFADFLWNADETKFNEIIKGLGLMGENPINGVIDLRLYPFNVATKNGATTAEKIAIGRIDTGITGIKLTNSVNSIINLGECSFFTTFKNFLDYEPYTTAQLYIPYIGVVPVSTAEFMGHNISVKMIVDYVTGACCAIVFKDDIPFIYRNGVVGISIPITGTDSASYANTVIGNVVSGAVGGITSIANGNIGGMVSSAEKLYSGFATGTNYQEASASSPSVATWQPQKCYFIIDRPILNVPDNYGRTVGYACEQTGKLSDFKGFTVVSNPEISFKCTETEKTMLSQLLTAGVFI